MFANQLVLITGAGSGLGFAMARDFLLQGAQVVGWEYSSEAIARARAELSSFGDRLQLRSVDVSNLQQVQSAAADLKTVSVLVNNAGITRDKSFAKMGAEEWDQVVQTDLSSLFYVTKSCLEKFNTDLKRIINISSVVGLYGNFGQANYAAAKAGVIGFTKTLAKELGRKGFTVNAVAPGFIQTPMTAAMPPEVLKAMSDKVPVQRLGTAEDISSAVRFLASSSAAYINGTVLSIDGGLTL